MWIFGNEKFERVYLCAGSSRYFIGNNYSPPFYSKGKNRPITPKNENAFTTLDELLLTNEIINILKQFTCHLYGYTKQTDIHEVTKIHSENKTKLKILSETSLLHQRYWAMKL